MRQGTGPVIRSPFFPKLPTTGLHPTNQVAVVVDDLLSETLFTLNEREIDARQYLLECHRIQAGDERYTLSLKSIDASLARDPFDVSTRTANVSTG